MSFAKRFTGRVPMKRIVLQEFVSVDARGPGPNGSVEYVPASVQGDQRFGQRQRSGRCEQAPAKGA